MSYLHRILFVIALASPIAANAQSLSQAQRNALNHLAQVMVIENNCSDFRSNQPMIAATLAYHKLRLSDAASESYFKSRYGEHEKAMRAGQAACLFGWSLYGKGGSNVPDLLIRR